MCTIRFEVIYWLVIPIYSEEELLLVQRLTEYIEYPKKTLLVEGGKVCMMGSYVIEGSFRYYTTNAEGREMEYFD